MNRTEENILAVSNGLSNCIYRDNTKATEELMDLFDRIARKKMNTPEEYIKMYDDNFYTYQTWEELVQSEKEQGDGLTEEECREGIGEIIWQLPCGWFVQYV